MKAQVEELLKVLGKDEESLKTTILTASGQLQYNRKMQEALRQILTTPTSRKKK